MGLCLDLGTRYLDQHRLDDAGKLFEKLDGVQNVRQYQCSAGSGRGVVLALRDQADESNKLFGQILRRKPSRRLRRLAEGQPMDPEMRKMWTNPQFRFWLAQAASYNTRNGTEIPPALKALSEPHAGP